VILPTEAEKLAIKADARKRYGSDRCMLVSLTAPVDACVVVAPFDLKSYSAHVDQRSENLQMAQASASIDRVLWCSPPPDAAPELAAAVDTIEVTKEDPAPLRRVAIDRLELLSELWPVVHSEIERTLRAETGQKIGREGMHAVPLTYESAPRAMPRAKVTELLDGAPKAGAGSMWSLVDANGCNLVLKCPHSDTWLAMRAAFSDAMAKNSGIVDSTLVLGRQLVMWSPDNLDAYFDAHPGYAEGLWNPLLEMGGAATQASASFL